MHTALPSGTLADDAMLLPEWGLSLAPRDGGSASRRHSKRRGMRVAYYPD